MIHTIANLGIMAVGILASVEIGGKDAIPIGVAVSGMAIIWKISSEWRGVKDELRNLCDNMNSLPCMKAEKVERDCAIEEKRIKALGPYD